MERSALHRKLKSLQSSEILFETRNPISGMVVNKL